MPVDLQAFLDSIPKARAHPNARHWEDWEDEFIRQAREKNLTWQEISHKLKVDPKTLRDHVHGVKT